MKYTAIIIILILGFVGCTEERTAEVVARELETKKAEFEDLQFTLKELQTELKQLDPQSQLEAKQKRILVTVDSVKIQSYSEFVDIQGNVETKGNYMVTSEMPGILTQMNIREGQYVKKGQLIATVDAQSLLGSKQELETALSLAQNVFERRQKLWEQNIGSELEFLQAENQVESLQKSLATLAANLSKASIYSPANGVVDQVHTRQFEMTSPGVPILTIVDVNDVQIAAEVSENYLSFVKRGDVIKVYFPALMDSAKATITNISPTIHPTNRTFKIEARISSKGGKLKPNLLADIQLKKYESEKEVVIPSLLIQQDKKGDYIFLAEREKDHYKAVKLYVRTGRSYNGLSIIESGLKGDEIAIEEGRTLVRDGSIIELN